MTSRSIVIVAHNVRSMWNVGAFFRTADVFGVSHVHLTGYTSAPPRKEITKTALGAEMWIPWSKEPNPLPVLERRRSEGFCIVSLEHCEGSVPLSRVPQHLDLCVVVGHEILGVPEEVRMASDVVAHIPMHGKKSSLNVSVALGVALSAFRNG